MVYELPIRNNKCLHIACALLLHALGTHMVVLLYLHAIFRECENCLHW